MSQTNETRSCVICTMSHDVIVDRWIEKPVKDMKNGKEITIKQRFKEYFISDSKKGIAYASD